MKMRLFAAAAVSLLVSCMGSKMFTIRTDPDGAHISINGNAVAGVTPITMKISQEKDLGIVATKPGYETGAKTVETRTSWWLALLWTKSDPRAQYIEEDEVQITLKKIPTVSEYRPSVLPPYNEGEKDKSGAPPLPPMPADLSSGAAQ